MKLSGAVLAVSISCFTVSVFAASVWVGPQGNPGHTGYVPITTNPANYHLLWDKKLIPENIIDFTTAEVIAGNSLYYAFQERTAQGQSIDSILIAVDTMTGNVKWKSVLNAEYGLDDLQPIFYSNNALIVAMTDSHHTYLYDYDPQTGKQLHPEQTINSGRLIAFDEAHFYAIKDDNKIVQLNNKNLAANWSVPYTISVYNYDRGYGVGQYNLMQQSDAANTTVNFFNLTSGKLDISIDVPGIPWSDLYRFPVIDDDSNAAYLVVGYRQSPTPVLYALDLAKHAIRWSQPNQNGSVNPVVANNVVYSVSRDAKTLNAIDAKAGVILWTWQLTDDDAIVTTKPPVVTKDAIFFPSTHNTYGVSLTTHQTIFEVARTGWLSIGDNKLFIRYYNEDTSSDDYVAAYSLS